MSAGGGGEPPRPEAERESPGPAGGHASKADPNTFRRLEQEGWTQVGAAYHDAFSELTGLTFGPMLDAAGVGRGRDHLDIACGPGESTAEAHRRGARTIGLDFSPSMLGQARERHPGIDFREGDAEELPFSPRSFDAVTMGFGMLHLARPERAMSEARRVLREGGRFAFTVWEAPERNPTMQVVLRAIETGGRSDVGLPVGPPFFRFADREEARRALDEAGFTGVETGTLTFSWRHESANALLEKFLHGTVRTRALLLSQTPEELGAIRSALEELVRPYSGNGGIEIPMRCVLHSAART